MKSAAGLKPSERVAKAALQRLWPDAQVEDHDLNTGTSVFDLLVVAPFTAAVEVSEVCDEALRVARDHWDRRLRGRRCRDLRADWHFMFMDEPSPEGDDSRRYRHQPQPDAVRLEAVLARLEARGMFGIGMYSQYVAFRPGVGWTWTDPDVQEVAGIVGGYGHATALRVPVGEPGGWTFDFAFGGGGPIGVEVISEDVERRLAARELADLRRKLDGSGLGRRVAALVYSHETAAGWELGRWEVDDEPEARIELPREVTDVIVIGANDLVLHYSAATGWSRVRSVAE